MSKLILLTALSIAILPIACAKPPVNEAADIPKDRLDVKWWKARHEMKLKAAKNAKVDLLFIGDSITHGWENKGSKLWKKYYAPRNAFNIGYSGDRTQHVLWRLENGEMAGMTPKVAVIMIGTNNTGHSMQKAEETASGVQAIIKHIHKNSPETKVLLLGIFPRGSEPTHKMRLLNNEINNIIKKSADGEKVTYLDISPSFLDDKGALNEEIMPDKLHPLPHGYQLWADAMEPTLKKLLNEK